MLKKLISLCGTLALAGAATASGADFPLTFRTIPVKEVGSFPGSSGAYGQLRATKPASLLREPKPVSRHPMYGECRDLSAGTTFLFRLDETKGDGRGYDQLIVDMNDNDDLTDDAVVQRTTLPSERATITRDQYLFGPIQAPPGKLIAGGRPVYYAQVYIFGSSTFSTSRTLQTMPSGQLTLKPGWYLETTVSIDGQKQKVGVIDGNSNLRLGDSARPQNISSRGEDTWYFGAGDFLLVDYDGSGTFEREPSRDEACPFGPILYLGKKVYKVALSSDCASLRVEPWTEPLAEVALRPHGNQVSSLTLAWEQREGQWQLIRTAVADGKVAVPPGQYRLYSCSLTGKGGTRDQVMVSATQRSLKSPVTFSTDKDNTLNCGAPLEVKVTATQASTTSRLMLSGPSTSPRLNPAPVLRINASLVGAGGEIYNTYLKGERLQSRPSKPTFTIADAAGGTVANGNLEYG